MLATPMFQHHGARHRALDFARTPFLVIWETTQACDLACRHCRASAQPNPLPGELTTEEGRRLIDDVAAVGTPIMVLSGGDPLKRPDLGALIRHGKAQHLRMGTIPAATPRLTREAVQMLKEAGLDQMALSLDASTAETHDRFRGVPGAFQKTMDAVGWAHEAGVPMQINTVLHAGNFDDIDRLIALVRQLRVVFWEVFFLVPMGRGSLLQGLTAQQYEDVFAKLYRVMKYAPYVVKITEAPHFRRYVIEQQCREDGRDPAQLREHPHRLPEALRRTGGPGGSIGMAPQGVNAGNGFAFIAYNGEIYPSGFLPVSAGNVRRAGFAATYQETALFRALRDPSQLHGRCGECEYQTLCGGSRSRAYAVSGDYLAEEPCCAYQP